MLVLMWFGTSRHSPYCVPARERGCEWLPFEMAKGPFVPRTRTCGTDIL